MIFLAEHDVEQRSKVFLFVYNVRIKSTFLPAYNVEQ